MITPKWITNDADMLTIGFHSVADAAEFIRGQSPNTQWRTQWTFRELESGEGVAVTRRSVTLHLAAGKEPAPCK